ncbi:C40 family peptidase [Deferribacter abyssi]|uniref:C40 family peptidase n=1 Tax=Deferribacter abyssi TaxID=213806 RepID=UPI003C229CB8
MNVSFYLKIPYKYNGRDETGIDCWGLVLLFYKREFRVKLSDYKHGTKSYNELGNFISRQVASNGEFAPVKFLKFGDLLLIKNNSEVVNHIAVYIGENRILHALDGVGVVVSKLHLWKSKASMFLRYRGIHAD